MVQHLHNFSSIPVTVISSQMDMAKEEDTNKHGRVKEIMEGGRKKTVSFSSSETGSVGSQDFEVRVIPPIDDDFDGKGMRNKRNIHLKKILFFENIIHIASYK